MSGSSGFGPGSGVFSGNFEVSGSGKSWELSADGSAGGATGGGVETVSGSGVTFAADGHLCHRVRV
jgi:hypothetical protein